MEHLQIAGGKDTLAIDFHPESGVLVLEGESYAENPIDFFDRLVDWLTHYIQEIHGSLTVNITINYLNTSSSKCLIDFLEMLSEYHQSEGGEVKLNWYYEEDDEDMQETGEELCEDLELSYALIPV